MNSTAQKIETSIENLGRGNTTCTVEKWGVKSGVRF